MLILSAAILFIGALMEAFTPLGFISISVSWVIFILFILIGIIYMNIGNKFSK